jgi:hypothetical protein
LRRFRLNGRWYCSRPCLETAALKGLAGRAESGGATARRPLKLGVLLRHMKAVTEAQLATALEAQRASGLRLGAQLRAHGVIGREQVLRALAAQSDVSFLSTLDSAHLRPRAGLLPAGTVRALGLVPFDADPVARRLRVICRAPLPAAAIRALSQLTGWIVEPYLADDEVWGEAVMSYRPNSEGGAMDALIVPSVDAAALQVGRDAERMHDITMRHVTCNPYLIVRVEATRHVRDMLVTTTLENTCPAELIAR